MSENYSLKELNEWADKVIDCISKWADEMNKAFNGTPTSIKIEKLDFTEHDKVFEDKIAELENIINHKLGNWDKHGITYQEILDMKAENDLLKQRIVELESKEMEKPTKLNLNDRVKVKLTPLGAEIYYHQYDDIHKDYPKMKKHLQSSLPKVDENGYTEFQLWHFMELYGEHIDMCKKNVISQLDIIIVE